jgi:hypothetical protein
MATKKKAFALDNTRFTECVPVRFTKAQYAELAKAGNKSGRTMNDLIRSAVRSKYSLPAAKSVQDR